MPTPSETESATRFPACLVKMPGGTEGRRATFFLAAEEFVAAHLPEDDYLFSWVIGPTVVMGRNQVAHQEINLDVCAEEQIDVVRRKSGGGAIFADEGNIMWSLVTGSGAVEPLFADYATSVAEALRQLGADTSVSGRNDILLAGGGKICGNAFYHQSDRNIVHGTMLYDSDLDLMGQALHPNRTKMRSKGVASVRSRVALLKSVLPFGVDELRERLTGLLCNRSIALTDVDVAEIERMEEAYDDTFYLYGQNIRSDVAMSTYFDGCGTVELRFTLKGSLIDEVEILGDYFELDDARTAFTMAFVGTPFVLDAMLTAVSNNHPEDSIRGLTDAMLEEWLGSEMMM